MDILNQIVNCEENNSADEFLFIENKDKKQWYINKFYMAKAFEIYQPTSKNGKLVKLLLPVFKNLKIIHRLLGIQQKRITLISPIYNTIQNYFKESDVHFSIFGGTPSVHQKVIVQIYNKDKILAYCKISESTEVGELFDKECEILEYLQKCKIDNVPKLIFRKNVDQYQLFCQSSVKNKNYIVNTRFEEVHYNFLIDMYEKSKSRLEFEDSAYRKMLDDLNNNIGRFEKKDQLILNNAVKIIRNLYEKKVIEVSMFHGDFTPWNMICELGQLKVFDFEYAQKFYPPLLDAYHFCLQTELFVNKNFNPVKVYENIKKRLIEYKFPYKFEIGMIMYLLHIICFYTVRSKKENKEEMERQKIRLLILKETVEIYEN